VDLAEGGLDTEDEGLTIRVSVEAEAEEVGPPFVEAQRISSLPEEEEEDTRGEMGQEEQEGW
jgi:hypothetical protein